MLVFRWVFLGLGVNKLVERGMSPERAGTPQEESATTPKMSVPGSPVAGTPSRDAQSAFSFLLAVAQSQTQQQNGTANKTPDDDLTSLTWLQDRDLLKGLWFILYFIVFKSFFKLKISNLIRGRR